MKTKNNQPSNISSVGYKSFASQFQDHSNENNQNQFQKKVKLVKSNNVNLLHVFSSGKKLNQANQNQMNLLHSAAFYNSTVCALYLLYNYLQISSVDKQGKSVVHLCAYTGHVEVLKICIEFWKMTKIKSLNEKFIQILTKMNLKRADAKSGVLKLQVSKQRMNKFNKGQQQIIQIYRAYRLQYLDFILSCYQLQDKIYSRNSFHYCALNKYQKCLTTLEYIIKSIHNEDFDMNENFFMILNQVNPLVDNSIDPRQYQDCLELIKDFILPSTLKQISNHLNGQIKKRLIKILQAKDKDAHNPIYLASKTGSAAIVSLLKKLTQKYKLQTQQNSINKNDDAIKIALNNSSRGQIVDLCQASKTSDTQIINFLISCGQSINKKKTIFGTFALLEAVKAFEKHKTIQPIQILLKSGADVNEQDINGWTIFHYIAEKGLTQVLRHIFNAKEKKGLGPLKLNKSTNKGYHPLHIAATNNQFQIIQILLNPENQKKYGIETFPLDGQKSTILHHAAKKGCIETLKKILNLKGKQLIGMQDINGNTCLHLAASNNHIDCIKQLIYFDSDFDCLMKVRNSKGKLAKDMTLKKKCFDNIFTAARQGDVNTLRNMLGQNPDLLNSTTPVKKRSPLILSVIQMQLVNVKFLVQSKANQQIKDSQNKSAKNYAVQLESIVLKKNKAQLPIVKQIKSLLV